MSLHNSLKNDISHSGVKCPNCDEHFESLHALVLKQIFKYYYPDTIEEDLSCVNPLTGHILPTDIVNHRLKIAIEVQGQWHRFENQKTRDRIKKDFWMNNGYTFYDYGIDNVSVLDYIKYFFPDLDEIPDWVNMDYNKKINIKKAQELLNLGLSVSGVAEQMNVNIHRIYDAIYSKKLFYPDGYKNASNRSVVMLNRERVPIKEYDSYGTAARDNNIKENLIASCIHSKRYYCKGYYWIPKDLYISGDFTIPENRTDKFFFPVVKYDLDGNIVGTFDDMYQAANDIGTIAYKIYEVIIGTRKTIKNYRYRYK